MKKLRIYLDTSIVSFVYADDAPEKQSLTHEFFAKYINKYDVSVSPLVLAEIESTNDARLRKKLREVVEDHDINVLTIGRDDQDIIYGLAEKYIKEKVLPARKFDDAVHVALCVYYEFDILLSWNFRHLANIKKQIQINAINRKEGYLKDLFLLNPMEVIYEN
jgi:predicted nucleic acid-binding protein